MADNRTAQQKALDDEAEALKAEAQTVEDQDQAESDEQSTSTSSDSQLPGQDTAKASESDQVTKSDVKAEDLVTTSTGVDLTATDTGVNPQAAEAEKNNPNLTEADKAVLAADPTPIQEATVAGSNVDSPVGNPTPAQTNPAERAMKIDASGLNVVTNQDVIDNFPKNANGQVEIDENGQIVGLESSPTPAQDTTSQE